MTANKDAMKDLYGTSKYIDFSKVNAGTLQLVAKNKLKTLVEKAFTSSNQFKYSENCGTGTGNDKFCISGNISDGITDVKKAYYGILTTLIGEYYMVGDSTGGAFNKQDVNKVKIDGCLKDNFFELTDSQLSLKNNWGDGYKYFANCLYSDWLVD